MDYRSEELKQAVKLVGNDKASKPAVSPTSKSAGRRLLRDAHRDGALKLHPREVPYLDRLQHTVEALPAKEPEFIDELMAEVDTTKFVAADYGIG
jgi:hypothetical protein